MSSYPEAWRDYRRRRNLFWAIFLTYVPGVATIAVPLSSAFNTDVPVFVIAALWMMAFGISGVYVQLWRCPRCTRHFFCKWWYRNPLASKCVHCGLPKWAEGDPFAT
jgi:amino acid transporter